MNYSKHVRANATPQTEPMFGTNQVVNSAGGFVFAVDDWKRLDRFLILGSEGGSYYASERKLTLENAEAVLRLIRIDGVRVVNRATEISEAGRAPKNDPALFVLAMAAGMGDTATRQAAYSALPRIARIGTHLFTFLEAVQTFRGWGRGLRSAVARWYTEKDAETLAYQLVKYRQRNGWSHFDALRLSHPKSSTAAHQALFRWVTKEELQDGVPELVRSFVRIQAASDAKNVIRLIEATPDITWEMIPSEFLGDASVWEALLPSMPMTALIRNLARMTANGLIAPLSNAARNVSKRLADGEAIRKARVHPIAVLGALTTYSSGHSARSTLTWNPVSGVVDALDEAFYLAFGNVRATGKRTLLGIDVSGSMGGGEIASMPGLTPRVASAAMAMVTARAEKTTAFMGFSHQLVPLDISPRKRLDDVVETMRRVPFGGTDCSLPMIWAAENRVEVDVFSIYTDNETWAGNIHPVEALRQYRRKMGIPAKLVVVGMVSNDFSIADSGDAGMLDVVGFDTATPDLIADFSRE